MQSDGDACHSPQPDVIAPAWLKGSPSGSRVSALALAAFVFGDLGRKIVRGNGADDNWRARPQSARVEQAGYASPDLPAGKPTAQRGERVGIDALVNIMCHSRPQARQSGHVPYVAPGWVGSAVSVNLSAS